MFIFDKKKAKTQNNPRQTILNDLKALLNEYNQNVSEISLAQYEKYANIKNEIDINREILIGEVHTCIDVSRLNTILKDIQKISAEMLNDIENFRN